MWTTCRRFSSRKILPFHAAYLKLTYDRVCHSTKQLEGLSLLLRSGEKGDESLHPPPDSFNTPFHLSPRYLRPHPTSLCIPVPGTRHKLTPSSFPWFHLQKRAGLEVRRPQFKLPTPLQKVPDLFPRCIQCPCGYQSHREHLGGHLSVAHTCGGCLVFVPGLALPSPPRQTQREGMAMIGVQQDADLRSLPSPSRCIYPISPCHYQRSR